MQILTSAALAFLLVGCSTPPDPRPIAEDVVCKAAGDLACVRVRVDERTPRSTYRGRIYYFCNPACREKFDRHPERYVP